MWQCRPTRLTLDERARPFDGSHRVAVAEVEAELRVVLAGGDELVGVGVHAGRDPQQHVGHRTDAFGAQRVEPIELVERVDDDVAHPPRDRLPQLGDALVVAVHHTGAGGHSGGEHHVQLATGRDVEPHPLVVGEPGHRLAQERLRGVDRPLRAERRDGLATPVADVLLVVHEQRRAEFGGEVADRAPADRQANRRRRPPRCRAATGSRSRSRCAVTSASGRVDAEQAEAVLERAGRDVAEREAAGADRLVGLAAPGSARRTP